MITVTCLQLRCAAWCEYLFWISFFTAIYNSDRLCISWDFVAPGSFFIPPCYNSISRRIIYRSFIAVLLPYLVCVCVCVWWLCNIACFNLFAHSRTSWTKFHIVLSEQRWAVKQGRHHGWKEKERRVWGSCCSTSSQAALHCIQHH